MRESYPPEADANSPAPPQLPAPPPEKFQFSLKQLLAFMLASAVLATGLRYVVQWLSALPDHQLIGWSNTVVVALGMGGLVYFFFRVPFLAVHLGRVRRRWNSVRSHRRELEQWSRERIKQREAAESTASINPEPEATAFCRSTEPAPPASG